ncbi:PTS lactose/cellobiose transporter subunit IIA [Virgibacillus sp. NKC19-3]|uniref:PTS lactose/cellobiose transporter subunit IIA n=1 Tax=Virgibacillus saliphilus TaxID=2831674 RepID=UPI001C9B319A|nr:PTS lactose/cellobiose transporter subunit IIA [Virgibacillus sp. NKC19-3]MBY7141974.1 PTS lactose/cellobiose transporter subunit IIA [Virgibacillus sp. NKC19-3]
MSSNEGTEAVSFGLIFHSGNARSYGMEAITNAKNGDMDKAKQSIEMGKQELLNAQKVHANMIQKEADGDATELSLLLMHSEDHFMMGQLTLDMASELVDVYQKLEGEVKDK